MAAIACFSAVMFLSAAASAVDRAAVYAAKSGVDDDTVARFRAVFTERLRSGGFVIVEVQGTITDPEPFVRSLDASLGRHGPYRLFSVSAAPSGKRVAVTIAEIDPRGLAKIDAITSLVADPDEFDRVIPKLVTVFIPQFSAPDKPAAAPAPSISPRSLPAPAPPRAEASVTQVEPPPAPFADQPHRQPCYKEPGELFWGLGVRTGVPLAGEGEAELGLNLRFSFETLHARFDIEGGAMGGGHSRLYDITAGASWLFSTAPTSFYLGGGLGALWMYGYDQIKFYGRGLGVDARAGVELMRHHRARFLIEGKLVLPLFNQDPDYGYKAPQYVPATTLTLHLLW